MIIKAVLSGKVIAKINEKGQVKAKTPHLRKQIIADIAWCGDLFERDKGRFPSPQELLQFMVQRTSNSYHFFYELEQEVENDV